MPNGPGVAFRWRADGKTMWKESVSILIVTLMLFAAAALAAESRMGAERIVGSWSGHANTGVVIRYRFTDQNVLWNIDDAEFMKQFPGGIQAKYRLEPGEKYLHLDMYDFENAQLRHFTLRGIVQFRDANRFRMTAPNGPTATRPREFDEHTVEFTREE
jgi:hypothetical protein